MAREELTLAARTGSLGLCTLLVLWGCKDRSAEGPVVPPATATSAAATASNPPAPAPDASISSGSGGNGSSGTSASASPTAPPAPTVPRNEMVTVPAGPFAMGCLPNAAPACAKDAQPRHRVFLCSYSIDKYEVTAGDYVLCMAADKCGRALCETPQDHNKPMTCVQRFHAEQYCAWVDKRLPTEAEWERAARGLDDRAFPWAIERACWKKDGP